MNHVKVPENLREWLGEEIITQLPKGWAERLRDQPVSLSKTPLEWKHRSGKEPYLRLSGLPRKRLQLLLPKDILDILAEGLESEYLLGIFFHPPRQPHTRQPTLGRPQTQYRKSVGWDPYED